AIGVRRERDVGERARGDPHAQVHGRLFGEVSDPERFRHAALVVAREDAVEDQVAARVDGELIAHVVEPHLRERGRTESGARGPAEGDRGRELEPGSDLAVERAAEVAIALEASGHVHEETIGRLAFEPGVYTQAIAAAVELVGRLEPREYLGARFLRPARRGRVEVDARPAAPVAQLPRGLFAGVDAVLFPPKLTAGHEREGLEPEARAERPEQVEVADGLAEGELSRVECRGAGRAHGGVVRMFGEVVQWIRA